MKVNIGAVSVRNEKKKRERVSVNLVCEKDYEDLPLPFHTDQLQIAAKIPSIEP